MSQLLLATNVALVTPYAREKYKTLANFAFKGGMYTSAADFLKGKLLKASKPDI